MIITQPELRYFLVFVTDDEREALERYVSTALADDVAHDFDREKLIAQVNAEQQYGRRLLHPGAFRTEYFESREALDRRHAETAGFTSPSNFD